jgi:5-(aminomethyl)-3-furanmethanol phosphate kinase
MSGRQPVRVVKVGGSLLRHQPEAQAKDLPAVLRSWLSRQSPALNVLVAGGGEFADAIRQADAMHGLGDEAAHWLCVDALSLTARLLSRIVNAKVISRAEEIPAMAEAICVFDPGPYLRSVEPVLGSTSLPPSWAVTSDSIAARIAEHLAADELVLLKSCLPAAATTPYVDDYFPAAAANLSLVRCVNLRSFDIEEIEWVRRP